MEFRVEVLEDEVEMEREEAEKVLEVSRLERWEPFVYRDYQSQRRWFGQSFCKDKIIRKFHGMTTCKQLQELPVLPQKKTNKFKLLGSKIKSKVNQLRK